MFWNHRVLRRYEEGEEFYYIVEVFYNDEGGILGWSEKEYVFGETLDELDTILVWMKSALDKPVLDEAELLAQMDENNHE